MLFFPGTHGSSAPPGVDTFGGLREVRSEAQPSPLPDHLRLLTFNIQAAICSSSYRDYITGSWKHLLSHAGSRQTLGQIAEVVRDFDVVALQEVDGGSLRSRQINQLRFLAEQAGFPFWHQQLNRNLGRLGQFSNGLLSRLAPFHVENHRLPGLPGRGAIVSLYGTPEEPLVLASVHLALGRKQRNHQLAYLRDRLAGYRRLVVMGDFNCSERGLAHSPFGSLGLRPMVAGSLSYPSWAPEKLLDHILVSEALPVRLSRVLADCRLSDHLPVTVEIDLKSGNSHSLSS